MINQAYTQCSIEELKGCEPEITKHIRYIIKETGNDVCDEAEYHLSYWIACDPDVDRGYEKFKFLISCGNGEYTHCTAFFAMQGAVASKNHKILGELMEYVSINDIRDEIEIVHDGNWSY